MRNNSLRKLAILAISSIGLYYSGLYLITIDGIKSLLDAVNVMTFFICFFPFLILSISLSWRVIKNFISFLKRTTRLIKTAVF